MRSRRLARPRLNRVRLIVRDSPLLRKSSACEVPQSTVLRGNAERAESLCDRPPSCRFFNAWLIGCRCRAKGTRASTGVADHFDNGVCRPEYYKGCYLRYSTASQTVSAIGTCRCDRSCVSEQL